MIKFSTVVNFEEGLHARIASELVNLCQGRGSSIRLTKDNKSINPKSILGLLALGAAYQDEIEIEIEGEDEESVAASLKEFFGVK